MLGGAIPFVLGAGQLLSGVFGKKPKRPTYRIPGEASEELATSRMLASNTVRPGNEEAVAQINQDTANAMSAAEKVSDNQSQILGANDRAGFIKSRAMLHNNALNSNFRYNAKLNLQNSLQNFAKYRDKAFQLNKMEPYNQQATTKGALISSGIQNIFGASQDSQNNNLLREIYGLPKSTGFDLSNIFKKRGITNIDASLTLPGIVS